MSIRIKEDLCVSCGGCIEVCPGNLIKRGSNGKAYIKRFQDCWGCTSCLKECQLGAISFFLGADVGGRGSVMHTAIKGDICSWIIAEADGTVQRVQINKKNANQY